MKFKISWGLYNIKKKLIRVFKKTLILYGSLLYFSQKENVLKSVHC